MISPEQARPRPDLTWLRHRRVEHAHIAYVHPPRSPAPATPSLDLSPAPSLDLSVQATPAPRPTPVPSPPTPAAPVAAPAAVSRASQRVRPRTLPYPRLQRGSTLVLTAAKPTVTLTRLQSGVGQLRLTLARGSDAGDLAAGLICQTVDGATYVVQRLGDALSTPAAPLPMVRLVSDGGLDTFLVDLRQVTRLRRALLYGYSPSVSVVGWDGVVVAATYDGSRVEAPFDLPPLSGTTALLTVYAVAGELVLRSELEQFAGPPEMAAEAYGYHYGWLGGRLPVP